MAHVILFHHVQGLTAGVRDFPASLEHNGHTVDVPDLFDGATPSSIEDGLGHAESAGFDAILQKGVAAASQLPAGSVYAGFSLGALVAHKLAQTRPGAKGALLYHHGDVPVHMFAESWPSEVGVQLHINELDPFDEASVADEFVRATDEVANGELFLYPGSAHLFTDSSLPEYEPKSAALVMERSLTFLRRLQ